MKKLEYYGTLGPSCAKEEILVSMIEAGMTGIRLNLSHKSLKESREWVNLYHRAAAECGIKAELLIDLAGPEIRIGEIGKPVEMLEGAEVFLGEDKIPVPACIEEALREGQRILLDDGRVEFLVMAKEFDKNKTKNRIRCKVIRGGILKSRKSLAVPGMNFHNPTLTKEDLVNLKNAKKYGVTAVMLPFVRGKEDLICLKNVLNEYNASDIRIFAKIENMEGVEKLQELLPHCDQIVIARGDLGNAVPLTSLPVIQHEISGLCIRENKPFMVVTQMLHSMMESPVPTRAEVTDIFHAVMEGAASLMLTGETAAGSYPVEAMKVLTETGENALAYKVKMVKK